MDLDSRGGRWARVAALAVAAALWTLALLRPVPDEATRVVGPYSFWVSKTLHVTAYGVLAVLIAWQPVPRYWRAYLVGLLVLHGGLTEFLQQFVGRHSSLRDVGLDALGVALGTLLCRRRWRRDALAELPQVPPQQQPGGQHADAADLG